MSGHTYITGARGWMEPAREIAAAAILAGYTAIGTPLEHACRIDSVFNLTDQDVWISIDGVEDHFISLKSGGGQVVDRAANGIVLPKGTTFYVKRLSGAPTTGSVYISTSYLV